MKLKDLGSYFILSAYSSRPESYLRESKRLDWIFIAIRWLWVPLIFLLTWVHQPEKSGIMVVLGISLGVCNAVASVFNARIKRPLAQRALGIVMLGVDTIIAGGIIFLFVGDTNTAAYAGFIGIIFEAAIRFGLAGSLSMDLLFIIGLYGAFLYRDASFGLSFDGSGYAYWTALMTATALSMGFIVQEGRQQRQKSEDYLKENILLAERHRIARELHDTVLKTLQGLALEARAMGSRLPSARETAQYIEDICSRTGREIRDVIFALRDDQAAEGISRQLKKMAEEWGKSTGVAVEAVITGEDRVLPPEPARQVRNIVAEALTNIQRHAAATRVTVTIRINPAELSVEISDNGKGLGRSAEQTSRFVEEGRLGIAGMKERTELLGGRFSLDSSAAGTLVSFTVPVS